MKSVSKKIAAREELGAMSEPRIHSRDIRPMVAVDRLNIAVVMRIILCLSFLALHLVMPTMANDPRSINACVILPLNA